MYLLSCWIEVSLTKEVCCGEQEDLEEKEEEEKKKKTGYVFFKSELSY